MSETHEVIYFYGRRYNSVREMPPKIRQNYEQLERLFADANADGVPDIFQPHSFRDLKTAVSLAVELAKKRPGADVNGLGAARLAVVRENDQGIYVNGRFYETPEDMPQEVFEIYDTVVSGSTEAPAETVADIWPDTSSSSSHTSPVLSESGVPSQNVTTTFRFFAVLILAILCLCVMIVLAWMFLF
jgi:hypothetical protein